MLRSSRPLALVAHQLLPPFVGFLCVKCLLAWLGKKRSSIVIIYKCIHGRAQETCHNRARTLRHPQQPTKGYCGTNDSPPSNACMERQKDMMYNHRCLCVGRNVNMDLSFNLYAFMHLSRASPHCITGVESMLLCYCHHVLCWHMIHICLLVFAKQSKISNTGRAYIYLLYIQANQALISDHIDCYWRVLFFFTLRALAVWISTPSNIFILYWSNHLSKLVLDKVLDIGHATSA